MTTTGVFIFVFGYAMSVLKSNHDVDVYNSRFRSMIALTASDLKRLDAALDDALVDRRSHIGLAEAHALRNLVLEPTLARWESLYDLALDPERTISLWQAVCNVSDFPSVVAVDQNRHRIWPAELPTALAIISALEYARA